MNVIEIVQEIAPENLVDIDGIVSEDVLSPEGATLIPRGTDLGWIRRRNRQLVRRLREAGISKVNVTVPTGISVRELDELLSRVKPPLGKVNIVTARKAIRMIAGLYDHVRQGNSIEDLMDPLISTGREVAREAASTPELLLSLAQVGDKDEYTFIHSLNVALLCGHLLSRAEKFGKETVELAVTGALLHDIGKASVPLKILNKPSRLTAKEFDVIKAHPVDGVSIAHSSGISSPTILEIIRGHHERWDGTGYPDGLAGDDIPLFAQFAAVADVFDALTAKRIYKEPIGSRKALSIITGETGSHFSPRASRALLVTLGLYPPGTLVSLSDSSTALVVSSSGADLVRPVVLIVEDDTGRKTTDVQLVSLERDTRYITQAIGCTDKSEI